MRNKLIALCIAGTIVFPTMTFAQVTDTVSLQKQLIFLLQRLLYLYIQLDATLERESIQYENMILAPQPPRVSGKSIKVTYPNGGEEFVAGTSEKIGWRNSENLEDNAVEIDLVDQNGAIIMIIADKIDNGRNSYSWNIPIELGYRGEKYKILVSSLPSGKKGAQDFSDEAFTIVAQ